MRGPTQKLTDLKIASALKEAKKNAGSSARVVLLGDGGGLTLQIGKTGTSSWLFRYMRLGKATALGLGPYPAVSLKAARAVALEYREILANGGDPRDQKATTEDKSTGTPPKLATFQKSAEDYIKAHRDSWKSAKHAAQWEATLATYANPVIGNKQVSAITVQDVKAILEPIWASKRETASRVRGRIEAVIDRAIALGERSDENPARWKTLRHILAKSSATTRVEKHHAALPHAEIASFMRQLTIQEGMARWALELLILTATRTSEVTGATIEEFDLDKGLWTIPAERMKAGKVHRIPLVDRAVEIVRFVRPFSTTSYVFAGAKEGKPLSQMAMMMLLRRMGYGAYTVHGFRSTFSDAAGETMTHSHRTVEEALAHKLRDKVAAAYARSDLLEKRKVLMEDWAAYCASDAV